MVARHRRAVLLRGSRRLLLAVTTTLGVLAATLAATPSTASACCWEYPPRGQVDCAAYDFAQWGDMGAGYHTAEAYDIISSVKNFDAAESRVVVNDTAAPASATFTSSISRSFQLTVSQTFGTGTKLSEFLRAEINIQIIQTVTTNIGVSATATVPAFGRLLGQYGVEAYDVVYDYTILVRTPDGRCWDYGADGWGTTPPQRVSVHAPTNIEGWRIS